MCKQVREYVESDVHCYCASKVGIMCRVKLIAMCKQVRKYIESDVHCYCASKVGNMSRVMFIATVQAR